MNQEIKFTSQDLDKVKSMGALAARRKTRIEDNPFYIIELRNAWEEGFNQAKQGALKMNDQKRYSFHLESGKEIVVETDNFPSACKILETLTESQGFNALEIKWVKETRA